MPRTRLDLVPPPAPCAPCLTGPACRRARLLVGQAPRVPRVPASLDLVGATSAARTFAPAAAASAARVPLSLAGVAAAVGRALEWWWGLYLVSTVIL